MAESQGLYALIQALTRAEKRYFKLFSAMGTGRKQGHYLMMFDCLNEMPAFDSNGFKASLRERGFSGNLASTQNRLYGLLLKSLRVQHETDSVRGMLRAACADLELLYGKRQFERAKKVLVKAKTLALQFEYEADLLILLNWEKRLFLASPNQDPDSFFEAIRVAERDCLSRLQFLQTLYSLHEYTRSLARRNFAQGLDTVIQNPVLQAGPERYSGLSGIYYFNILGLYYFSVQAYSRSFKVYEKLMSCWDAQTHLIREHADLYLGSINNFLMSCIFDMEHEVFFAYTSKLRQLNDLPASSHLQLRRIIYSLELQYAVNFSTYSEGLRRVEEVEGWLKVAGHQLSVARRLSFYLNLALFYFGFGQVSGANRWVRAILNMPGGSEREDIRDFARLFQVIIQFELGNFDLQEHLRRSSYRYFARTQKRADFERIVIRFSREVGRVAPGSEPYFQVFEALRLDLQAILEDRSKPNPLGLDIIFYWAQSKLMKIPFRQHFEHLVEVNHRDANAKKVADKRRIWKGENWDSIFK